MNCYACNGIVKVFTTTREGVKLKGNKCASCGEEFFPSGELLKFEALTGRNKRYRKFGKLGNSIIIRFPEEILAESKVKPGDLGLFETTRDGILIRPLRE